MKIRPTTPALSPVETELGPGIYRDLDFDTYRAIRALSPSGSGAILRSPAHYLEYLKTPSDAAHFRVGSALHCLALEGRAAFADRFAIEDEGIDGRTKEGKAKRAAFREAATGKTILTAAEGAQVEAMARSLTEHPLIPDLLDGGETEVSMGWDDPETGAPCKGRPDVARFGDGAILDLKSTQDASPGAFARSALNYGYLTQGGAYLRGAAALGIEVEDFILIAVEKTAPFACAVYHLPDEALALGDRRWSEAVRIYADCLERDSWPGYPERLTELSLPGWATAELYREDAA